MSNNDERMIFYCKGVIETVRKLGWKPDIIHCQGWMSSLVPMYIKKLYNEDPLFENVKVIYSVFDNGFKGTLSDSLAEKLLYEDLTNKDVDGVRKSDIVSLHKFAISYADAIIQASPKINKKVLSFIESTEKPFMNYPGNEDYIESYQDFYNNIIKEEEVVLVES